MSYIKKLIASSQVRHGLKVGVASVLAYVISGFVGVPYAYWAVITTVIVMQVHVADSIHMCLYRFTGTALGAGMGILLILIFPATPMYTLLGIFVGTGICAYLTRYNVRFRMAAITVAIVYLTSLTDENRILFTLSRVAEIGIGVMCAFLVSVILWPRRAGAALRERLEHQYGQVAVRYTRIMDNFLSLQQKTDADLFDDFAGETEKNKEMFHKVFSVERRFFRDDVNLLSTQVNVLRSVLERLQSMLTLLNQVEGVGFDIIMAPELTELTRATTNALRAIGTGTPHDTERLEKAVSHIETRFIELRRQGVTNRFGAQRLFQVLGFISSAQRLGEYLINTLKNQDALKR
ncbi:FUSC family protein [Pseudodesulfovibrio sp. JC047]|uniref:FUSC family protein n=1 Tax=Pseudodesulfovibrio sp. JC047 TaxID=2683199 RepID=UPI0013D2F8F3|nr:FUSC family protein [Pseudodesulfovibrio sp. JC047]NDV18350.1 FUSC family protein [Pseudodesulfovibrio sp. JC047]